MKTRRVRPNLNALKFALSLSTSLIPSSFGMENNLQLLPQLKQNPQFISQVDPKVLQIVQEDLKKFGNAFSQFFNLEYQFQLPLHQTLFQIIDFKTFQSSPQEMQKIEKKLTAMNCIKLLPIQFDLMNDAFSIRIQYETEQRIAIQLELLRKLLDGVSGAEDCERMALCNALFLRRVQGLPFSQLYPFDQSRVQLLRALEEINRYNALHCVVQSERLEEFNQTFQQNEQNVLKKLLVDLNAFETLVQVLKSPFSNQLLDPAFRLIPHTFRINKGTRKNPFLSDQFLVGCLPLASSVLSLLQICAQQNIPVAFKIAFYETISKEQVRGIKSVLQAFQLQLSEQNRILFQPMNPGDFQQPLIVFRASKNVKMFTEDPFEQSFLRKILNGQEILPEDSSMILNELLQQCLYDQKNISFTASPLFKDLKSQDLFQIAHAFLSTVKREEKAHFQGTPVCPIDLNGKFIASDQDLKDQGIQPLQLTNLKITSQVVRFQKVSQQAQDPVRETINFVAFQLPKIREALTPIEFEQLVSPSLESMRLALLKIFLPEAATDIDTSYIPTEQLCQMLLPTIQQEQEAQQAAKEAKQSQKNKPPKQSSNFNASKRFGEGGGPYYN
jgi:hypothetical protein